MKDNIFIGWSGSNDIAVTLKKELETKYNYRCFIGGNADNSSSFSSVGDTVIQQIKNCNQAIIIFQNRADGAVSNNLFFELGYVLSSYGQTKVHCIKRKSEQIVLPSDFDNSFVEPIDDGEGDEAFIRRIIKYFITRQKLSVNTNKMYLIDNRYLIHDFIQRHYSESGSKCSDYELAQYVLFYTQAAHMFDDCPKTLRELLDFKHAHQYEFSSDLSLAVNIGITFLSLVTEIKMRDDGEMYIEPALYRKVIEQYNELRAELTHDDMGTFDEWADAFMSDHICYAYNLYASNPDIDKDRCINAWKKVVEWTEISIKDIERLQAVAPIKESNDHVGLLSLIKAYVYRNRFLAEKSLNTGDELKWLQLTRKERISLKRHFENGMVDTHIMENLDMEYYLCLTEYISNADRLGLDKFEVDDCIDELREYVEKTELRTGHSKYVDSIFRSYAKFSEGRR